LLLNNLLTIKILLISERIINVNIEANKPKIISQLIYCILEYQKSVSTTCKPGISDINNKKIVANE
jgi:hypothetical protein